jgi:Lysyl oxidase/Bacterial Ig domain
MALRRSMLALAATAAVIACAMAPVAAPAQVTERLPDLVSDAPANPQLQTFSQPDGNHLLLRFDGYVHNQGQGALEMRGSDRVGTEYSTVVQRVYRSDGSFLDDSSRDPHMIYEPEDGHVHWHLKDAARYSLWNEAKTAEVAPAMKTGFCLIDSQRRETHGPSSPVYDLDPPNNFCGQNEPTKVSLFEGVSAGWRDIYPRTLAFQWVDVSDVSPGRYWLRAQVDPDDWARESNEVNAAADASSLFTIPGYAANPVAAGTISATGPTTIPLSTTSFGSGLGSRVFRTIVPPRHGTLSVPNGTTFTTSSVVYTPHPGWAGPDRFTYTVHHTSSSFPRYPTPAAVTLNVGGVFPNVSISGAPETMYTGTSARLLPTVLGDDPFVTYTVNGVSGGSPATGRVDDTGLYVAPATAPPGGTVTIRATSEAGAYDEVTISVVDPPPPEPAPSLAPAADASREVRSPTRTFPDGRRTFRRTRLAVVGDALVVTTRPGLTGIARVRVRAGDRLLGRCLVKATRGRALTCRVLLPSDVSPAEIGVVMTFRVKGRLMEVRRFRLAAAEAHHHHP